MYENQGLGGIVGSLWALAGVLLFYAALRYQKMEFEDQRKQLELQRKELTEQTKQFFIQNETLKKQRFENTFFQMISLHHEIIDKTLLYTANGKLRTQREAFKEAKKYLLEYIRDNYGRLNRNNDGAEMTMNDKKQAISEANESFFKEYHSVFSHYFGNLYMILMYIHRSNLIPDDEKIFYGALIRCQLSSFELVLIFYYSIGNYIDNRKFTYLLKKFKFMRSDELFKEDHFDIFNNIDVTEDPFVKH